MLRAVNKSLSIGLKLLALAAAVGLTALLADVLPEPTEQSASDESPRHVPVYCVSVSPDGEHFAAVSMNYRLSVGTLGQEEFPAPVDPAGEPIKWAIYSPVGQNLILGCADGRLLRWDPQSSAAPQTLGKLAGTVWRLAISHDGRLVAGLSIHPAEVQVWEVATGRRVCRVGTIDSDPNALAFSADGRQILTHHWTGKLVVWDVETGRPLQTLEGDEEGVGCVAGAPDTRRIASGDALGWVRLRDIESGKVLWETESGRLYMRTLVFSPDGRHLACGGYLGRISLLDPETGDEVAEAEAHQGAITTLNFSPDGSQLISAGEDGAVCVWSLPQLELRHRLYSPAHDLPDEDIGTEFDIE